MSAVLAAAVCVSAACALSGCDGQGGGSNGEVKYNIQATGNYSDGIMLPNLTTEQSELHILMSMSYDQIVALEIGRAHV